MQVPSSVMKIALRELKKNQNPFKHISVITHKGRTLVWAMNQRKTHPQAKGYNKYVHAELGAILKFKGTSSIDLRQVNLYNIRIGKSGLILNAAPCSKCAELICAANFKKVYFTNQLGLLEEFIFKI